ncbi:MAG: glycosyl hydrolase family 8 [Chloroflexota bacterium]
MSIFMGSTPYPIHGAGIAWSDLLKSTWAGYKQRFIYCGDPCAKAQGLVHDPSTGYTSVSEGIGYGLLMAVTMNDQATFNDIYQAAEQILLDKLTGLYNWKVDQAATIIGFGAATDADQDIAVALIFAEQRVKAGEWQQNQRADNAYGVRASALIDALYRYTLYQGKYLLPGNKWLGNGMDITNPSYFAPAWYRLYDKFQNTTRWQAVIDQGYTSLYANEGAPLGLAPDWMSVDGQSASEFCQKIGIPADGCKFEMTYDAIRVPWRIGLDCLWFSEARACEWSKRTVTFLHSLKNPVTDAKMFDMAGQSVIGYQDELMLGMWLTAAIAAKDEALQNKLSLRLSDFTGHAAKDGFWGSKPDSGQYYFSQSLAWFGVAMLTGDFKNLYP